MLPAPAGHARAVAAQALADVGYSCARVTYARRLPNGAVTARCDGRAYLIFIQQGFDPAVVLACHRAPEFGLSCRP